MAGKTALFATVSFCALCVAGAPVRADVVTDPALLDRLDDGPLAFGRVVEGRSIDLTNAKQLMAAKGRYAQIVRSLRADLDAIAKRDPKLSVTMSKSHRLFNKRWLSSPSARFELVGLVNRLDRAPFERRYCGETRLVYRLAYTQKSHGVAVHSRLPFTVNVVYFVPKDEDADCKKAAIRWERALADGDALTAADGPVAPALLRRELLKAVEVNMQSVRWPSTVRPDLGAHAEYLLRVFVPNGRRLLLGPLENTPDVSKIKRSAKSKKRLLEFLRQPEQLAALDEGVLVVPVRFLAKKATSVSPRGLHRLANRPYEQLFDASDFAGLALAERRTIRTPSALLRRLDDLTCQGCHQGRSVAGFHLLGVDRAETSPVNAVNVTGSPHLMNDLGRRARYRAALVAGTSSSVFRPFSERADDEKGGYGAHCGLGDAAFRSWTCGFGLECARAGAPKGDDTVGQCFPVTPSVGDPCELGSMVPNSNPHKDRVRRLEGGGCGDDVCEANYVGFPEGMCATSCGTLGEHGSCGSIAILGGFNRCLSRRRPFTECLADNVRPAGLRACSDTAPCRDDYLCARTAKGGACIPPYFLFQMRVDGHPRPRRR